MKQFSKSKRQDEFTNSAKKPKHEKKILDECEILEHYMSDIYGYKHEEKQRKEMLEIFQDANKSFRDQQYNDNKIREIINCIDDQGVHCVKCHEEHVINKNMDERCMYYEREFKKKSDDEKKKIVDEDFKEKIKELILICEWKKENEIDRLEFDIEDLKFDILVSHDPYISYELVSKLKLLEIRLRDLKEPSKKDDYKWDETYDQYDHSFDD